MDACEPGLGGAQSWPKNKDLETQALVYEGPKPGCPSLDALGTDRGGSSVWGRPTFPASLVQEDEASSPLPPLDLFRQPKCTPGNESDFRFDKNKNKLGCPSHAEHSHPLPTLLEPPGTAETMTVSGAGRIEGGGCHGNHAGSWRGGCPEGPGRALDTAQPVTLLFGKWQV